MYYGRERNEKLCPQGQRWQRNRSFHGEITQAGSVKGRESGPYGYQAERAWDQESAHIHRRAQAGKEAEGCSCVDACTDLEAKCQEGRNREAGGGLGLFG